MHFTTFLKLASFAIGASAHAHEAKCVDASLVAHNGTPVGYEKEFDGVNLYIAEPKHNGHKKTFDTAVLYLTDVFGIQLRENKLLADSFSRAGYLTVAPDLFNGTPAPADINTPGTPAFNTTQFLAAHQPNVTDPLITSTIKTLKSQFGVSKIAVTGYCYGGRYVFRFLDPSREERADVGFTAHPSLLSDAEITAIGAPVSVALAETDSMLIPSRRVEVQSLLQNTTEPYSLSLFGGTSHGFGVRANVTDPKQRFAKEQAYLQAVNFFRYWV